MNDAQTQATRDTIAEAFEAVRVKLTRAAENAGAPPEVVNLIAAKSAEWAADAAGFLNITEN